MIWGTRGQAVVLSELAAQLGHRVAAYIDDDEAPPPIDGVPVLRGLKGVAEFRRTTGTGIEHFAIAVGGSAGRDRLRLHDVLEGSGMRALTLVHPAAYVSSEARLGEGNQVLVRAVVGPRTVLGAEVIVNTNASIDHECSVGDGSHVGPGATVAGRVTIGHSVFVGAGAVILPYLEIGSDATIGAGSVVTRDVAPGQVVVGNPARPMDPTCSGGGS